MHINSETAQHIIDTAVTAVVAGSETFTQALDELPAAIYVTDREGTITYFNRECVKLAGRVPEVGRDKWCVTWKLYTNEGEPLPHDRCPMALAIQEKRQVRNLSAIAERPDGTRVSFIPYPTPLFDSDGNLTGAVNLLVETSEKDASSFLCDQAAKCRLMAKEATDPTAAETLNLMAIKYDEQASKLRRSSPR